MDIPAAHNDAQGLSVMRSAPKLRPRTPMSGLVLPSCAQRRPWPAQAGTGTCVHIPIQLIPIASLAWLGKQQPCPLLSVGCMGLLETECDTHTHTHIFYLKTMEKPGCCLKNDGKHGFCLKLPWKNPGVALKTMENMGFALNFHGKTRVLP